MPEFASRWGCSSARPHKGSQRESGGSKREQGAAGFRTVHTSVHLDWSPQLLWVDISVLRKMEFQGDGTLMRTHPGMGCLLPILRLPAHTPKECRREAPGVLSQKPCCSSVYKSHLLGLWFPVWIKLTPSWDNLKLVCTNYVLFLKIFSSSSPSSFDLPDLTQSNYYSCPQKQGRDGSFAQGSFSPHPPNYKTHRIPQGWGELKFD